MVTETRSQYFLKIYVMDTVGVTNHGYGATGTVFFKDIGYGHNTCNKSLLQSHSHSICKRPWLRAH